MPPSRKCYLPIGEGGVRLVFSGVVCSVSCLASPVLSAFKGVIYRRKNTTLAGAADSYLKNPNNKTQAKLFKVNRGILFFLGNLTVLIGEIAFAV